MTAGDGATRRTVWFAAFVVAAVYGGIALTVDFPEASGGIQSDEATYYLMGHSLAADGDLEYRREDLQRTYRDFPSGPSGIFLKRGTVPTGASLSTSPPFLTVEGRPDPDRSRLYYGKSFVYPLLAAPFVWLLGTNGFLLFNALLLTAAVVFAGRFAAARSGPTVGILLASAFVFATVVPVYFVWIAPELFNFSLGLIAYVLWLYKYVAPQDQTQTEWLRRGGTDIAAGALVGLLTFSKVTNVLLLLPMAGWLAWRGLWRRAAGAVVAWGLVTALLFGANIAVTGEWNYQGGDRATCYGPYPFATAAAGLEVCADRGRDEALGGVIFDPEVFWSNLRANLVYMFVGRNSGLLPYFFPGLFAMVAVVASRRRESWQWFVLAGVLAHLLLFVVSQPYSWFGGGGSVGNRYFMGAYGMCLVLLPPLRSAAVALLPWAVGALFMAKLALDPFQTSIRPGDHAKSGLFRYLPVELTNTNDLPLNTDASRVRLWYGETGEGHPGFQIYYLDDNAYLAEADGLSFWIRGESTAQLLIKTVEPEHRMELQLSAGAAATETEIRWNGRSQTVALAAGETTRVQIDVEPGLPFKRDRTEPAYVWVLSISSSAGFVPALEEGSPDTRFLGVRVRPIFVD